MALRPYSELLTLDTIVLCGAIVLYLVDDSCLGSVSFRGQVENHLDINNTVYYNPQCCKINSIPVTAVDKPGGRLCSPACGLAPIKSGNLIS